MIKLYIDRDEWGTRWRLLNRMAFGADVVARSHLPLPPGTSPRSQLMLLSEGAGTRLRVGVDRHWRWTIEGPDGAIVVDSPPIFRNRAACAEALADARRAAATLLRSAPAADAR